MKRNKALDVKGMFAAVCKHGFSVAALTFTEKKKKKKAWGLDSEVYFFSSLSAVISKQANLSVQRRETRNWMLSDKCPFSK